MSVKSDAIKAELRATAYMIGSTIPQFIEDDDNLKTLASYIQNFRQEIQAEGPREESLVVIDGFLAALAECLSINGTDGPYES